MQEVFVEKLILSIIKRQNNPSWELKENEISQFLH